MNDDTLITIGEAAKLRGVTVGAVQGWILRGWLASAGSAPSPHPRGPRVVAVYWRSAVLAVAAPGRGRGRRSLPPTDETGAIRAVRSRFPRLNAQIATAALRASGGDVDRACDLIRLGRR